MVANIEPRVEKILKNNGASELSSVKLDKEK